MSYSFDHLGNRFNTGSRKWSRYPPDVLPLWLADLDFALAPPILEALQQRLLHPYLGYSEAQPELRQTLVEHLRKAYDWQVEADALVFLPGVEPGVNMALSALLPEGVGVVVQTPNHLPLREAPGLWQQPCLELPFTPGSDGDVHTNIARLAQILPWQGALLLSNPHNPLGKVFPRTELEQIAAVCVAQDALIISDEIHADLLFDGRRHVPIATLSAEVAQRTVTLLSASKAYNIAGMKTAFAVITNPALRSRFNAARRGMVDSVNALGLVATQAAYAHAGDWLAEAREYLQANRDWLLDTLARDLPEIRVQPPQGTFLAWLDCSALGLADPQRFFLDQARVGLSAGHEFGADFGQFVRLNFGCPRALLEQAVGRLRESLSQPR